MKKVNFMLKKVNFNPPPPPPPPLATQLFFTKLDYNFALLLVEL